MNTAKARRRSGEFPGEKFVEDCAILVDSQYSDLIVSVTLGVFVLSTYAAFAGYAIPVLAGAAAVAFLMVLCARAGVRGVRAERARAKAEAAAGGMRLLRVGGGEFALKVGPSVHRLTAPAAELLGRQLLETNGGGS